MPTTLLVVDSTPLIDLFDVDACWGKSSKVWFKGFKIHASVNQQGLPLRAKVTPANCYDSPILPDIAWDLKANYLLADAGYDSKLNRQVAKTIGAVAVIAKNRRKSGKQDPKNKTQTMYSELLRAKRYLVEQFNGHFKANLLKACYLRPKGLAKKAAMVYAALISYVAQGLRAFFCDETSLKSVNKYRGLSPKFFTVCVTHTFQTGKIRLKAQTCPQQYINQNTLKKELYTPLCMLMIYVAN